LRRKTGVGKSLVCIHSSDCLLNTYMCRFTFFIVPSPTIEDWKGKFVKWEHLYDSFRLECVEKYKEVVKIQEREGGCYSFPTTTFSS